MLQAAGTLWHARLYRLYLQNVPTGSFSVNGSAALAFEDLAANHCLT
jgi:hypothetical protein